MTVATTTRRADAVGNGAAKVYPFTFRILDDDDLLVSVEDTSGNISTLAKTTDYTVSGVGAYAGGEITLVNNGQAWLDAEGDLKTNYKITIRRILPLTQLTDLRNRGGFFPEDHETVFDRLTMIALQQQDELDRSLKFPETDDAGLDAELPAATLRASKYIVFDASGNVSVSAGTGADSGLRADLAAASGSSLVGFTHGGTGAATRTVQDRLRERISVKDYGAVGDGATDDTAAVHLARDAAGVGGYLVFPAPGTYVIAALTANVNQQTWYVEPGAKLKLKDNSNANAVVVNCDDFTLIAHIDGNRAVGNGSGGSVSVQAGSDRTTLNLTMENVGSYGVYAEDAPGLTVIGTFKNGSRPPIFTKLVSSVLDVDGPYIDATVDYSGESNTDPALQGILVRGVLNGARFKNGSVRARVKMPLSPTVSNQLCCELWSVMDFDVDIQTYGGSMGLSLLEARNITGHVNAKGFNYYGLELGGECEYSHFSGVLDGRDDSGTALAINAIACQGTGANKRCSFHGLARGATGAGNSALIYVSNGSEMHFDGSFDAELCTYLLRAYQQSYISLSGRLTTGAAANKYVVLADYRGLTSGTHGFITVSGYAQDFEGGAVRLEADGAIVVDQVSAANLTTHNCGRGYIVTAFSGGAQLGERISKVEWIPAITFTTPGNLAAAYSLQQGWVERNGDFVVAHFALQTSSFTHSTASGELVIHGLPVTSQNVASERWTGPALVQGVTKSGYTSFVVAMSENTKTFGIAACGSGQAISAVTAADMPSGGTVVLRGTVLFRPA